MVMDDLFFFLMCQCKSLRKVMSHYSATYIVITATNSVYRGQQFLCRIYFGKIAARSRGNCLMDNIKRTFLAYEEYFGLRGNLENLSASFNSIQLGQPYIEQNQVRLKCLCFQ